MNCRFWSVGAQMFVGLVIVLGMPVGVNRLIRAWLIIVYPLNVFEAILDTREESAG